MNIIDFEFVKNHLPLRPDNAHKGTMGSLCAVTGSFGFSGASILCAKAALRTGVGLLYQILPESIYPIFASSVFEAVCVPVKDSMKGSVAESSADFILDNVNRCSAAVIGCGLKNNEDTRAVIKAVVTGAKVPLVVDADGLNALSMHIHLLEEAKQELILTPHPKEFSRLTGLDVAAILSDRQKAALDFSKRYPNITLVLKGHRTLVAKDGVIAENRLGNSGMAKGGSGDALTGIIGALTAQGVSPFTAARMGVFIHAMAGDLAAGKLSKTAMLPTDLIDSLPEVFQKLENFS